MNVITKFSALGLAAVLFAACSDSASDGGNNLSPEVTGIGLSTTGGSTVTNYKTSATAKAPRRVSAVSMDNEPNVPDDAVDISKVSGTVVSKNIEVRTDCQLPTDVTFQNCTFYVKKGILTFGDLAATNKIVVKQYGILKHTNSNAIAGDIDCYGTFEQKAGTDLVIGGTFKSANNISVAKGDNTKTQDVNYDSKVVVNNGGVLYTAKTLRAAALTVEAGGSVVATDADFTDKAVVNNGEITLAGHLKVKDLTLSGSSATNVAKYIYLTNSLAMSGSATLQANSIDASTLKDKEGNLVSPRTATMEGTSSIVVNQAGYLTFDNFNAKSGASVSVNGEGSVAVFKARNFVFDKTNVDLFKTSSNNSTFLLELTNMTLNGAEVAFEDAIIDASYYDYAKAQANDGIKEATFDQEEGYKMNTTQFNALPKLDLIATVENAKPDYMSATCIASKDNNLYVSYHTRDNQHGANIEVFTVNGTNVSLTQSLKDNDNALDFNNCIVDDNRLYLSGSHVNAGGGFAYIDIASDGKLNTTATTIDGKTREPLQFVSISDDLRKRTGVDANSAVKWNGQLVVATTEGYYYFTEDESEADKWNRGTATTTTGKAKSVIVSNGQLWGLNFASATSDNTTPVGGVLNWTSNSTFAGASNVAVGNIAPTNGKNTIAADAEGNIYVCRGQFGVQKVKADGTVDASWSWSVPTNKSNNVKGYANGVTVDGDYVYVACGGYGLVILEKSTGKELCHRTVGKSANYVVVKDGYIYVANGENRVQMFKLNYTVKK